MLVFYRPGGLEAGDRARAAEVLQSPVVTGRQVQRYDDPSGETLVLAVAAQPGDIPPLRSLLQARPAGLTTHVTGIAALAHDAVAGWERSRPLVLAAVSVLAALVAFWGRLGLVRALVVGISAGAAGLVTSTLAALFATPGPLALATVLSASLAAAGAARLLLGLPLSLRTPYLRPPEPDLPPSSAEPAAPPREMGPVQWGLVVSGEMALLQAFLVLAGLVGFLVDYRAGAALGVGVLVGAAVNLSATPVLVALLTRPRRTLPPPGKVLRLWARIGLILLPLAGLYLLTPAVRPQDWAARWSEAAVGHELLVAADSAVAPGRRRRAADRRHGGGGTYPGRAHRRRVARRRRQTDLCRGGWDGIRLYDVDR